jgi:hypothetical protein
MKGWVDIILVRGCQTYKIEKDWRGCRYFGEDYPQDFQRNLPHGFYESSYFFEDDQARYKTCDLESPMAAVEYSQK